MGLGETSKRKQIYRQRCGSSLSKHSMNCSHNTHSDASRMAMISHSVWNVITRQLKESYLQWTWHGRATRGGQHEREYEARESQDRKCASRQILAQVLWNCLLVIAPSKQNLIVVQITTLRRFFRGTSLFHRSRHGPLGWCRLKKFKFSAPSMLSINNKGDFVRATKQQSNNLGIQKTKW